MAAGNLKEVVELGQAINGSLAPAIMISASALMILALQGKYSQLIDRLRALNEERRKLKQNPQPSEQRMMNVVAQIELILLRARLVRNSIGGLYLAIAMFGISSFTIGVSFMLGWDIPVRALLFVFMLGMFFVLLGVSYAFRDIARAFSIAKIEVRGIQELHQKK